MAILRLDKIHAGATGNIESVVVYADNTYAVAHEDFDNGLFVTLGGIDENGYGREVHSASPTTAETGLTAEILLVASPEVMYDEKKGLDDFKNLEGEVARAYYLTEGDVITFTDDLLPEGVKVGNKLVAGADGKLVVGTGEARYAFEVIEDSGKELHITKNAHAFKVLKDATLA